MSSPTNEPRRPRRRAVLACTAVAASLPLAAGLVPPASSEGPPAAAVDPVLGLKDPVGPAGGGVDGILETRSTIQGSDGRSYWVQNHLDQSLLRSSASDSTRKEYLLVWAGDANATDSGGPDYSASAQAAGVPKQSVGPDFLAVVDATKGSPTYGKVVNTATVGPLVQNEPHHMQYVWHKGDNIFAGALYTDITYVFDVSKLPQLSIKGVNLPTDTPCGSVPDAYWVTHDGGAYGTYMGGPNLPGPCTYTDGAVRVGNGFGGSPGEVVRLNETGQTISEAPAATSRAETKQKCDNIPALPKPTCANPHGIQAREDLDTLITSDYNEPRNIILNPVSAPSSYLRRPTIRTWDISKPAHPKLKSVSFLPDGPRKGVVAHHEEPRAAMEVTVTNQPEHKGAFAQTMQGGAIYYTPDITAKKLEWREVFDVTTSNKMADPSSTYYGGGSNGGWVQTSLDDHYLYHAVGGRPPGTNGAKDKGSPPYILKLDISELVAAGENPRCSIDTIEEITAGGQESDCPAVADILPAPGRPHWGALDNLELGRDGYYHETEDVDRIAYSNYFVARTGLNGDHRVCLANTDGRQLSLDQGFDDATTASSCIDFDRTRWPHGELGPAKPHSMLFVTSDANIR
jgi:hypothetical protein